MYESMIDLIVGKAVGYSLMDWIFKDHDNKFIQKMKKGVKLYEKPINNNQFQYKQTNYDRRITSMRIFTHTKK